MWTLQDRALVGDFGAGQALSDEQYRLLELLIPPAKPGGRPRTVEMRRLLDGLFYVVRTGCQWRHLPPPSGVSEMADGVLVHAAVPADGRPGNDPPAICWSCCASTRGVRPARRRRSSTPRA